MCGWKSTQRPLRPLPGLSWAQKLCPDQVLVVFRLCRFWHTAMRPNIITTNNKATGVQFSGATWRVTVNNSLYRRLEACTCIWPIMFKHEIIHKTLSTQCIALPAEEGQSPATVTYWKLCEVWMCGSWDMQAVRWTEDAVDRGRWKLIKSGWWSGWWVSECFFWYRLTQVVPDKGS